MGGCVVLPHCEGSTRLGAPQPNLGQGVARRVVAKPTTQPQR
jgi:hypothetical protein